MPTVLRTSWSHVRDSLWFLPGAITLLAAALAFVTLRIDLTLLADQRAQFDLAFQGGVEGARGVLSAIASTTITVTGLVFSITMVALQLASSQYSPRVLNGFIRDRGNQLVLGVFIGTFTYSLLVLRMVRSAAEDGSSFVPSISVAVAIFLALLSIGLLIYYIHHAARSIQASVIIDRAANDTLHLINRLFPEPLGEPAPSPPEPALPAGAPAVVTSDVAGYLQAVDADALFGLAEQGALTIRMEPYIGEFVLPGAMLASVWPPTAVDDRVIHGVRRAFVLGIERTPEFDVELGLRQLSDIAVKALSPGINDPTTAVHCSDRLAQALVTLGNRQPPDQARTDEHGRVCFLARETTFARAVQVAFDQVCYYGARDPVVAAHLLATLGRIGELVPAQHRGVLAHQASVLLEGTRQGIATPEHRALVERAAEAAFAALLPALAPPRNGPARRHHG